MVKEIRMNHPDDGLFYEGGGGYLSLIATIITITTIVITTTEHPYSYSMSR